MTRGAVLFCVRRGEGRKRVQFPDAYPFILDKKLRSPWYDNEYKRCASPSEVGQELDIDFLGSDYQFFDSGTIDKLILGYCRDPDLVGDLEFPTLTH